ncbi:MAG: hypothetical protein IT381_31095 [Deltaproteobacteria bacterium]|nr:hypothetical protein [Deltaproteobacteria bacterium]
MMRAFLLVASFVVTCVCADAVDAANLINKDKKKYDVEIACEGATTKVTIAPNGTQEGGIESGCEIRIAKQTKMLISTGKNAVIKGGVLREE